MEAVRKKIGNKKTNFLPYRLEKIIRESLRRKSDIVMKDSENIYVTMLVAEDGAKSVMERLKAMIEEYLNKEGLSRTVLVNAKAVTFNPAKARAEDFSKDFNSALEEFSNQSKATKTTTKILVVDDEFDTIQLLKSRLEANHYEVLSASDGNKALELARREKPSLMILDCMLPGMDGIQVCSALKKDPKYSSIPIILFTAKAQQKDMDAGLEAGANAYLTKPIEPKLLLEKIHQLLSQK